MLVAKNVDPSVALGFFHHESGCGNAGRAVRTRSWGNLRFRPIYAVLNLASDLDGFAAYSDYTRAAMHFALHLRGEDGTANYGGLTQVEQVVPVWAPSADGNSPLDYIAAVVRLADDLRGGAVMPKVLCVAGHLRTQLITEDGLCDRMNKPQSVAILRGSTGAFGESDYAGDFVTRLADALKATGAIEAVPTDSIYHQDLYESWNPDLVLAVHFHRDAATERAMFAAPAGGFGFNSPQALAESERFVARLVGGYEAATGIPVTQPLVTLRMTQLYTWCYLNLGSAAAILELGNANVDTSALYDGIDKIVRFTRNAVLEHFNVAIPGDVPRRRATDTAPPPQRTLADVAVDLDRLAAELRARP